MAFRIDPPEAILKSFIINTNPSYSTNTEVNNVPPKSYIDEFFRFNNIDYNTRDLSAGAAESWLISLAHAPRATCTVTRLTIDTPLNALAWAQCLASANYPNANAAAVLVLAIRRGLLISYHGPRIGHIIGRNLPSAFENAEAVNADIEKECNKHRRHGPHDSPPFPFYRANPLGIVHVQEGWLQTKINSQS